MNYLPRWCRADIIIEGASQRIQEDTMRFARLMESIGLDFARAVMTLIAFGPLLWEYSKEVEIPYLVDIPGSLFWVALLISIGGTYVSKKVGFMLPGLQYNNQVVEASLRQELTLGDTEGTKRDQLALYKDIFVEIRKNYFRLFLHYSYFALWSTSYSQVLAIVPYVIMGPSLFSGVIMLGVLTQTANAFDSVQNGFGVFINNWTEITELQSIWKRLHEFERRLEKYEGARA